MVDLAAQWWDDKKGCCPNPARFWSQLPLACLPSSLLDLIKCFCSAKTREWCIWWDGTFSLLAETAKWKMTKNHFGLFHRKVWLQRDVTVTPFCLKLFLMKTVLTSFLSNGVCWADFEFSVLLLLMLTGCPLLLAILDVLLVSSGKSHFPNSYWFSGETPSHFFTQLKFWCF